jgi:hypothetical protein
MGSSNKGSTVHHSLANKTITSIFPPHTVVGNNSVSTDKNFKDSIFDDLYNKELIGKRRIPVDAQSDVPIFEG